MSTKGSHPYEKFPGRFAWCARQSEPGIAVSGLRVFRSKSAAAFRAQLAVSGDSSAGAFPFYLSLEAAVKMERQPKLLP